MRTYPRQSFLGRSAFLSFSSIFRAVTGPGFQDVTFSEFCTVLIWSCFHSREFALVEKIRHANSIGEIVDFENN